MQTKKCSKCGETKSFSEYFKDNKREIGIRCKCKTCCKEETKIWRNRNRSEYNNYIAMWRAKNPDKQHATEIKRHYGLSIEKYNELLTIQECKCKICGKLHDPSAKKGRLYVDHNHDTGKIRGLLCMSCNIGIGNLNDDIDLLIKAIKYLQL